MRHIVFVLTALAVAACASKDAPDRAVVASAETEARAADVAALTEITRILIDASTLYAAAAAEADDRIYAEQLRALAARRGAMADEFQAHVAFLGGNPAEFGQAAGAAHRAVMEARLLTEDDTRVAVEEALRGEDYLLGELNEAARNGELSEETRAFVERQVAAVAADRERLGVYAQSLG